MSAGWPGLAVGQSTSVTKQQGGQKQNTWAQTASLDNEVAMVFWPPSAYEQQAAGSGFMLTAADKSVIRERAKNQ